MKWPNIARRSNRTFVLMCLASRLRTPRFSRWIKDKDWQQFKSDGYMVVRDVIPKWLTTKAVLDIAAFVGADIRDSTTWYRGPVENDGMVALHHAQSLWNIRQYPTLHQVFSEYYGTHKLMVDIIVVVSGHRAIGIGQRSAGARFTGTPILGPEARARFKASFCSAMLLGAMPVDFNVCSTFIRTWKPGLLSTRSARISISSIQA